VPEGGSKALGALGYVACVRELLGQLASPPDVIVAATGSGGTLAGLALGCEDAGLPTHVIGIAVCDDAPYFEAIVERIAAEAHAAYGLPALTPGRYRVLEGFQGRGYGLTTEPELAFMLETLRHDGLALGPVLHEQGVLGPGEDLRKWEGLEGRGLRQKARRAAHGLRQKARKAAPGPLANRRVHPYRRHLRPFDLRRRDRAGELRARAARTTRRRLRRGPTQPGWPP